MVSAPVEEEDGEVGKVGFGITVKVAFGNITTWGRIGVVVAARYSKINRNTG